MAGKLPAGPISTVSESSILAVINAPKTDYIYFIANISTGETFFYTNSREFEAKKAELSKVNGGL
jgi:cell division protein YceG involved in septum cleavage